MRSAALAVAAAMSLAGTGFIGVDRARDPEPTPEPEPMPKLYGKNPTSVIVDDVDWTAPETAEEEPDFNPMPILSRYGVSLDEALTCFNARALRSDLSVGDRQALFTAAAKRASRAKRRG